MKMKKILIISLMFIFLLCLNIVGRKINITIEYADQKNNVPYGLTTLYFDNGNGFEEKDSVYEEIQDMTVHYSFHPLGIIKGLRIIPMRDGLTETYIDKLSLYIDDILVEEIEGEEFYASIAKNESAAQIEYIDDCILVKYKESEPWPYINLNYKTCLLANSFSWNTCVKTILCLVILFLPIGIKKVVKHNIIKKKNIVEPKQKLAVFMVTLLILWFLQKWLNIYLVVVLWLLPYLFYSYEERKNERCNWISILAFGIVSIAITFSCETISSLWTVKDYEWNIDYIILIVFSWIGTSVIESILSSCSRNDKDSQLIKNDSIIADVLVIVTGIFTLYEMMKFTLTTPAFYKTIITDLIGRMMTPVYLMNLFWGVIFLTVLCGFLGKGLGIFTFGIASLILIIGNAIKIYYHNTLLTPIDFLQIEEMFRIAESVIGTNMIALIILVIIALVIVGFWTRNKWIHILKPRFNLLYVAIPGIICIDLTFKVISFEYEDRDVFYKGYENEFVNERYDGVVFYNLINISKIKEIYMDEPDNYSYEYVQNKIREFETYIDGCKSEVRPNVILIMAESLFDIENVEGLAFNEEIETTLQQYESGMLISPRYGGYTSAVEYEALTGLSLIFYPSALVPYTTYFNQVDKSIPSIAHEFKNNGYETYAIHPNDKTFYNRDIAYQMLGFDEFLDKTAFEYSKDNVVAGTFLKDMPIAEKITELISTKDEPVFAFATTIAGHYMKEDRYSTTEIFASHDSLNTMELNEIEQAATSYKETDDMFRYLVEFIKASEEPTLLYVFGDHLPPLPTWNKLNYASNFYEKYGTVLASYSNFSEIVMPEYMTPNQLAAQLMVDSGICHSSYYDYIYSLRNNYPIIHSELLNDEQLFDLETYHLIQYDIMFGNQWFYKR